MSETTEERTKKIESEFFNGLKRELREQKIGLALASLALFLNATCYVYWLTRPEPHLVLGAIPPCLLSLLSILAIRNCYRLVKELSAQSTMSMDELTADIKKDGHYSWRSKIDGMKGRWI